MAKETTYAGMLGDLQKLVTALSANSGELTHLEGARAKLEKLLAQAQEVAKQQAAFTAGKQESSRQLKTLLTEGVRLANALRVMLKEHYGIRSEKLAEYGLQPFRGKARKAKPEEPELPPPSQQPSNPTN
jgi:type II secretory pathway component PulF